MVGGAFPTVVPPAPGVIANLSVQTPVVAVGGVVVSVTKSRRI